MIEYAKELPQVLSAPNAANSISMVRALKQIKSLLEDIIPEGESHEDRINASLDDIETMLDALK